MNGSELSKKLRSGKNVYGTLITSNSPRWIEVTAGMGLDYVFIDTEHVALDRLTLSWMCQAYKACGLPPIVRIPSPDPYEACKVLDGGAVGIVAPYVENIEQVKNLRGAVKLRPLKGKRLEHILSGDEKPELELEDYVTKNNAGNLLIINIESVPALENLEDILAVPGLDAILIGPHDLSNSLGIPEQYTHPVFDSAVLQIIRSARMRNVGVGIHMIYDNIEQEIQWINAGLNFIMHSADIIEFAKGIRRDIDIIRRAVGIQKKGDDKRINI